MRNLPTRIHGAFDYGLGLLLIVGPWLFGFATGGAETTVPVLLGTSLVLYSLLTAYELGALPVIDVPTHLALDAGGGLILAMSPWLFEFSGVAWLPHLVLGFVLLGTALMTETVARSLPRTVGGHGLTSAR